jgi:hypothetical protein
MQQNNTRLRVVPRVLFESQLELSEMCEGLLFAYSELVQSVITQKIASRITAPLVWTELERLMFGISTFDDILDEALPLVLATTKGNGVLYAHELNACIVRSINRHNIIFFHGTTSFCEQALRTSLGELLVRLLVTSANSHYYLMLNENFERFVAWDKHEWLVCPRHRVVDYKLAVLKVCDEYHLIHDITREILRLLGFLSESDSNQAKEVIKQHAG